MGEKVVRTGMLNRLWKKGFLPTVQEVYTALSNKVDREDGKGLSSNDYTDAEKSKLSGVKSGAEANVQSDWNVTDAGSDAFIKNKPTSLPASDVSAWAKASSKPAYTKSEVGLSNVPNVSTNDQTPTFTQAGNRTNIASGEKLSVLFGKIMKYFSDLKTVAFTGSYTDLSNKPAIPSAVAVKGNAESSYRTGNVNITPADIGLGNVNNTADANKSVASAGKATNDGDGNKISTTYARKQTVTAKTIPANGWQTANGKTAYSFESVYPFAQYDITVEPDGENATEAQVKAWILAKPAGSSTANRIIVKGTKPSVDIPVIVKAVKK